jgi:hypothetical protein
VRWLLWARACSQVTIGDGSSLTQLLVGSPATGEVNGVNIVALANSAVKNSGDQSIAGERWCVLVCQVWYVVSRCVHNVTVRGLIGCCVPMCVWVIRYLVRAGPPDW